MPPHGSGDKPTARDRSVDVAAASATLEALSRLFTMLVDAPVTSDQGWYTQVSTALASVSERVCSQRQPGQESSVLSWALTDSVVGECLLNCGESVCQVVLKFLTLHCQQACDSLALANSSMGANAMQLCAHKDPIIGENSLAFIAALMRQMPNANTDIECQSIWSTVPLRKVTASLLSSNTYVCAAATAVLSQWLMKGAHVDDADENVIHWRDFLDQHAPIFAKRFVDVADGAGSAATLQCSTSHMNPDVARHLCDIALDIMEIDAAENGTAALARWEFIPRLAGHIASPDRACSARVITLMARVSREGHRGKLSTTLLSFPSFRDKNFGGKTKICHAAADVTDGESCTTCDMLFPIAETMFCQDTNKLLSEDALAALCAGFQLVSQCEWCSKTAVELSATVAFTTILLLRTRGVIVMSRDKAVPSVCNLDMTVTHKGPGRLNHVLRDALDVAVRLSNCIPDAMWSGDKARRSNWAVITRTLCELSKSQSGIVKGKRLSDALDRVLSHGAKLAVVWSRWRDAHNVTAEPDHEGTRALKRTRVDVEQDHAISMQSHGPQKVWDDLTNTPFAEVGIEWDPINMLTSILETVESVSTRCAVAACEGMLQLEAISWWRFQTTSCVKWCEFVHNLCNSCHSDDRWEVRESCVILIGRLVRLSASSTQTLPSVGLLSKRLLVHMRNTVFKRFDPTIELEPFVRTSALSAVLAFVVPHTDANETDSHHSFVSTAWRTGLSDSEAIVRRAAIDIVIHCFERGIIRHVMSRTELSGFDPTCNGAGGCPTAISAIVPTENISTEIAALLQRMARDGDWEIRRRVLMVVRSLSICQTNACISDKLHHGDCRPDCSGCLILEAKGGLRVIESLRDSDRPVRSLAAQTVISMLCRSHGAYDGHDGSVRWHACVEAWAKSCVEPEQHVKAVETPQQSTQLSTQQRHGSEIRKKFSWDELVQCAVEHEVSDVNNYDASTDAVASLLQQADDGELDCY